MDMHRLPAPRLSRKSYVKHRQDVIRQIILPVALVTLIIGAVAVLTGITTFQGGGDISRWAAISTIWILIPLMALLFVILILACGVVYLLGSLLKVSPRYTGIAQEYALWFNAQIMLWTDRIIQPILKIKSWLSMFSREK
jgi:hypothetical protein